MNCRELQIAAQGLLEGEPHPDAEKHLAACPRCRVLIDELVAITHAARSLPEIQPSPRLWAQIQAAAVDEGLWSAEPSGWKQWLDPMSFFAPPRPAFAGGFSFMLAAALVLASYTVLESPAELALPAARAEEVAAAELVAEPSFGQRYQVHLQQVEQEVLEADRKNTELLELAAGPLDDLDRAIAQTQGRVDQYPDDTLAREELHRLYQQKATVLQAMNTPAW
jgi:hypothetical protein